MKSLTDCYGLNNGVQIPCVGFGTWQTPDGDVAVSAVKAALECGYRHIDTAADYQNEASVGRAIKESGIPREELFVTSKLLNREHDYGATMMGFERTMKNLGLDYLDLYLIHWPNPLKFREYGTDANVGSWKAMEELYHAGRIRAIGISNFRVHHMEALMARINVKPMVNQMRLCPGAVLDDVVKYCHQHNILLEAYSPLGTGKIFGVPEIQALSKKYGKTVAQLCIRWSLQNGFLPLPKSVTPARIRENAQVFDFEISPEDMRVIASLTDCCGPNQDPDEVPW